MVPDERLQSRLLAYCRVRMPNASNLRVEGLQRLFGGASRETWRFELIEDGSSGLQRHPLILRRDPDASLIQTERRREFEAYRAFEDSKVPVPRTWWLEEDASHLGSPFFVMQAVEGAEGGPARLMADPYREHHASMGRQFWQALGQIARADPRALADGAACEELGQQAWRLQLDHWAGAIDAQALEPQPIAQAAIRWLRKHPPPPPQRVAIVHGDYRIGNALFDPHGGLSAVLDWEMAHVGDPLEDLAWSINRSWCFQQDDQVGGLLSRQQALAHWQQASGLAAESEALHWWELMACVKGQGIWLGAARAFATGANQDLLLAFAGWLMPNSQDRAILELMGHLA